MQPKASLLTMPILLVAFYAFGAENTNFFRLTDESVSAHLTASTARFNAAPDQEEQSRTAHWAIPFRHPSIGVSFGLSATEHDIMMHEGGIGGGSHRVPLLSGGLQVSPISLLMVTVDYFSTTYSKIDAGLIATKDLEMKNSQSGFDIGLYAVFPITFHYDLATLLKSHDGFYVIGGIIVERGEAKHEYYGHVADKDTELRETMTSTARVRQINPSIGISYRIHPRKNERVSVALNAMYQPRNRVSLCATGISAFTDAAHETSISPITDYSSIDETLPLRFRADVSFHL